MIFSTGLLLCINWIIFVFKSSSYSSHRHPSNLDHLSIQIIMEHHHWIWIISRSGSTSLDWIYIITRSRSSLGIITGSLSSLDLDHPWCYLMILLITGIYTEPSLFHAGQAYHHVGLHPALTSNLLVRRACPTLTFHHIGTNPIITSERPSTHIHRHDRTSHH